MFHPKRSSGSILILSPVSFHTLYFQVLKLWVILTDHTKRLWNIMRRMLLAFELSFALHRAQRCFMHWWGFWKVVAPSHLRGFIPHSLFFRWLSISTREIINLFFSSACRRGFFLRSRRNISHCWWVSPLQCQLDCFEEEIKTKWSELSRETKRFWVYGKAMMALKVLLTLRSL